MLLFDRVVLVKEMAKSSNVRKVCGYSDGREESSREKASCCDVCGKRSKYIDNRLVGLFGDGF